MSRCISRCVLAGFSVLAMGLMSNACAQATRSGGSAGGSSQMMQQYQQLASERTALQTENAKLKADLDAASKERDALKKERDALRAKSSSAEGSSNKANSAALLAAEQTAAQQRKGMEELIARYRETATNLDQSEKTRAELQAKTAQAASQVAECTARNAKLHDITIDVLDRYSHMSSFGKTTIDEPFTRIMRTRVDNLVDETKAQVDLLTVSPSLTR